MSDSNLTFTCNAREARSKDCTAGVSRSLQETSTEAAVSFLPVLSRLLVACESGSFIVQLETARGSDGRLSKSYIIPFRVGALTV